MSTIACIAARNEEQTIGKLVLALRALGLPVVVVDDASTDATARHAEVAGARVVSLTEWHGIAGAIMEGWRTALAMGAKRVLQIDAGGAHVPWDAMHLLDVDADLVIGSRFLPGSVYINYGSPWRPRLSRLAAFSMRFVQRRAHYSDVTSGLRVYSRRAIEVCLSRQPRARMHAVQVWWLALIGEAGLTIRECPNTYYRHADGSTFDWSVAAELVGLYLEIPHCVGAVRKPA